MTMHEPGTGRPPDIRRRLRARDGGGAHAMKMLLEAARLRSLRLRGRAALLIGFLELDDDAAAAAREIVSTLRAQGVEIRFFTSSGTSGAEHRSNLLRALQGIDIVFIDTDSMYFRTLRPKEMRAIGAEIIIPTTLQT